MCVRDRDMQAPFAFTDGLLRNKTILAIFTSSADRGVIYQNLAHVLGVRIIMVSTEKKEWALPFIAKWVIITSVREDVLVPEVLRQIDGERIDGVVSFDEYGIYPCAVLAQHLGKVITPLPPHDVMHTQDKALFRKWCHSVGLTAPREIQLSCLADIDRAIERLSQPIASEQKLYFPLIVKPSPGAGSSYVMKCDSPGELRKCATHAFASLQPFYAFLRSDTDGTSAIESVPPSILVEEYIEGDEVDIDCLVHNGQILYVLISDNFPSQTLPFFVESGGLAPSALADEKLRALRDLVETYVTRAGPTMNGILHFEAKYDTVNKRAVVIEANLRLGAAETFHLNIQTTGIDIAIEYVKMAVGIPPMQEGLEPAPRALAFNSLPIAFTAHRDHARGKHFASVNFPPVRCRLFTTSREGTTETALPSNCPQNHNKSFTLQRQCVPESVLNDPFYIAHRLYFSEGYCIQPLCVNTRALGWMLCWGSTPAEAQRNLDRLSAQVIFEAFEV